jgi:hypothetical protein
MGYAEGKAEMEEAVVIWERDFLEKELWTSCTMTPD